MVSWISRERMEMIERSKERDLRVITKERDLSLLYGRENN